ncbi:hypothetical protein AeMF1_005317 [Aphanomyces euteiches]|nr:hypothetical protein AeMF1_005317 [Aphanomyces euteiches]
MTEALGQAHHVEIAIDNIEPTQNYFEVENLNPNQYVNNQVPVEVKVLGEGRYEVVDGHHRLNNAILAKEEMVRCSIVDREPTRNIQDRTIYACYSRDVSTEQSRLVRELGEYWQTRGYTLTLRKDPSPN